MSKFKALDLKDFFFLGILLLLGYWMIQLILPFFSIIVVGLVIVELFHPVYRWLSKKLKNKAAASLLTTVITLLTVVIPIVILALLTIVEINNITSSSSLPANIADIETFINNDLIESTNNALISLGIPESNLITEVSLYQLTSGILSSVRDSLLPITTSIIGVSFSALFNAFMLIITLVYLFIEYENLPISLSKVSPLDNKLDHLLFTKFTETTKAVIKGSFLIAIVQATAVSLMLSLLGIGAPVLLWVLMVIFSIIPVGSGIVWAPAGIILAVSGRPIEGIFLILYSGLIINIIDPLLRPYLMKDSIMLHPLIILFSVIGGITLFGPIGILYGPLIAVFFSSLMDIYTKHFTNEIEVIPDIEISGE